MVPQDEIGHRLLQRRRLLPKFLDLGAGGLARRVARNPLLAGLKELLRPAVIEARRDPLAPAELGNAAFAARLFQDDEDRLFGGMVIPSAPADVTRASADGFAVPDFCLISTPWRLR